MHPSVDMREVKKLPWDQLNCKTRIKILLNFMEILRERKDDMVLSIVNDMNKSITEGQAEVTKCIDHIQISCDLLRKTDSLRHTIEPHPCDLKNSSLMKVIRPLGSILVISPWNFPLWLPFKTIISALLMGNTIVHRPSTTVNRTNQLLKELIDNSEIPNSVWRVTDKLSYSEIEEHIKSNDCQGVSFTGSTEVGKIIAQHAASELKPIVMELGGSDLMIISEDYNDYKEAAKLAMKSRCMNNGQVCIATKRVCLNSEEAQEAFIRELEVVIKDSIIKVEPEDKSENSTQIPLTRLSSKSHFDACVKQLITLLEEDDAHVAYGDFAWLDSVKNGTQEDIYFPPFVISNVKTTSDFWNKKEFMCPVLMIARPSEYSQAIEKASSPSAYFGLGGTILLSNAELRVLRKNNKRWGTLSPISPPLLFGSNMRCGMLSINSQIQSHSLIPFGGVNNSGMGRECGVEGFKSFTYVQCISIPKAGGSYEQKKDTVKKRMKMPKAVGTTTSKLSKKVLALTKIGSSRVSKSNTTQSRDSSIVNLDSNSFPIN